MPLRPSSPESRLSSTRPAPRQAVSDETVLPRLPMPEITLDFDDLAAAVDPPTRTSTRRDSQRSMHNISDRISSLRPDRGIRNMTSSLRRRRSPIRRGEDQAAMLSRLLSVAAAATAATLMGGDHRAVSEARDIAGDGDDDATFAGFLQSLQNGRIASALRQSGSEGTDAASDEPGVGQAPMNFFRMFRFGSNAAGGNGRASQHPAHNNEHDRSATLNPSSADDADTGPDGRMIPIIIVGIRSITPGAPDALGTDPSIPPFLDALSSFPSPLNTPGAPHNGGVGSLDVDALLRPAGSGGHHPGTTRFSHRRRASMGGISTFPASYENQRHSRTLGSAGERPRPVSLMSDSVVPTPTAGTSASNTPTGPRPPPSTPASAALSAFSSGASTPVQMLGERDGGALRRESALLRGGGAAAAAALDAEARRERSQRGVPRHRRLSESDFTRFGAGAARRNGVVGSSDSGAAGGRAPSPWPASNLSTERERERARAADGARGEGEGEGSGSGSRSWIIYVLGGQYPENHPILTTPSLFTDSPTYEDMLLLSALLGPAKPPVASREDVRGAGGVFRVVVREEEEGAGMEAERGEEGEEETGDEETGEMGGKIPLMAVPTEGEEEGFRIREERCLVCLCDFEAGEEVRRLVKCSHLFHRECIDQVSHGSLVVRSSLMA